MTASWTIVAAAAMLGATAAPTQQQLFQPAPIKCFPTQAMHNSLTEHFRESLLLSGFTNANQVFEVHASSDMDTWTAIIVLPQHIACTIASGRDLQLTTQRTKGKRA